MADLHFGTYLAPSMFPTYEAIATAVGKRLGMSVELTVETDYARYVDDVNDVSIVCGLPYVTFEREGRSPAIPIAAPVLIGERYGGRPCYFSDVIVHRTSQARGFRDLRGHSWAYNEKLSQSGYGVTRHHLLSLGETDGFFGAVIEAGSHGAAIEMVRNQEVNASGIDTHVLEVAIAEDPGLVDDVIIIDALGPSTIQPITVSKRLPADMREALETALTGLHADPVMRAELRRGRIERITAVGTDDYDDIRRMLTACEQAGFMEIR